MYPSTIFAPINPTENSFLDDTGVFLDEQISNLNDEVSAIETKLGIDGSLVATTIEYILKNSLSVNPGHKHTTASITFGANENFVTATQLSNLHAPHSDDQTIPVKATGAETNTGTDNDKFVTPKAIADSYIASLPTASSTTTFTNKTLTSPKINEDVALTATATQLNALVGGSNDGWTAVTGTWTYASASTITVDSGAAAIYAVGDRIRWKQGAGYKYGVLVAVADTVLNIMVNTDFTVATPTAITDMYYSHQESPIGYPQWFAMAAPTWTVAEVDNGSGGQPTNNVVRGKVDGRLFTCTVKADATKAGTSTNFSFAVTGFPTIANSTTRRNCIGNCLVQSSATVFVGAIMLITGYYYWLFNASITDNMAFDNAMGALIQYEI